MAIIASTNVSKGRVAALVMAIVIAFCLGGYAGGLLMKDRAYADDGSAGLQSANTSLGEATLITQLVNGKISDDKQSATLTMTYGDKTTVSTNGASGQKVRWVSSNKKVVKVKSVGKYVGQFSAVGAGKATVTAYTGNNKLTVKVTVKGKLSTQNISLNAFQKKTVKLKGAKVKSWKSSDKKVAKVSKAGAITPMATGKAVLTCKDTKGNKYTCAVTVTNPKITCKLNRSFSIPSSTENKTYYYKEFDFTNKSGKKVTLAYSTLRYLEDYSVNSYTDLAAFDVSTRKYYNDSPVSVANGKSTKIVAAGLKYLKSTDKSEFFIAFKVGKVRYAAAFLTSGTPVYFGRAS